MNKKIKVGDLVIVPEPNHSDDAWLYSGFVARVVKLLDDTYCIVEDADGDGFTVEKNRLRLA